MADGRWHDVVAVHSRDEVQLLPGREAGRRQLDLAGGDPGPDGGGSDGAPSDPMAKDGMTVEFSAVDRPLTGAEVKQRYQAEHR